MPISQARVAGSNFTTMRWNGQPIAYLQSVSDTGTSPVGTPQTIHPLGSDHPTEVAVPDALNGGTLSFTIKELWNKPVWQHLAGITNANDIIEVWRGLRALPNEITCLMVIKNPASNVWRTKTYHNVVITNIDESEDFGIATMTVDRNIDALYTHITYGTTTRTN